LIAYHNSVVTSVVMARGRVAPLAVAACVNSCLTLGLAYWLVPQHGVMATVWSYALYIALQLGVMYLVAIPASGAGSGFNLASQVFFRPVLYGLGAAGVVTSAVTLSGAPTWAAAPLFLALFMALAFTVGGATKDWTKLKSIPA
jgi:hypothetical protein